MRTKKDLREENRMLRAERDLLIDWLRDFYVAKGKDDWVRAVSAL